MYGVVIKLIDIDAMGGVHVAQAARVVQAGRQQGLSI
jgi:hypothetical protein